MLLEQCNTLDFPYAEAWDGKRYHSYIIDLKKTYGGRIQKVSIHADFTCPNRDGNLGRGGCTFCNNDSFTPAYLTNQRSISKQLDTGLSFLKKRYRKVQKFVGYFQAYTNTYGSLSEIKKVYEEALQHPEIDGLVIGTRPDCLSEALLDYLQELAEKYIIVLELGIESCYNDTLKHINRGHTFEQTKKALEMASGRGFHIGGHLMFGFPTDSRKRMLEQVEIINALPLDSIKFHQLQIVKGTVMAHQYKQSPEQFNMFESEEYINFLVRFIERLRPDLSIQRFSSEAPSHLKIAPNWNLRADQIQQKIEKALFENNTWQGKYMI